MSRQLEVGKKYKKYNNETISHALSLVRTNAMSLREASRTFSIPKSTLSDKLQGKSEIGCKSGPPTVLSENEETLLAEWIQEMAKRGFGRTREELLDTVQIIIKQDGRPSPFTNSRPGKDWYYGFLKRHPDISTRAPQQLAKERAVITPQRVDEWFRDFKAFMSDEVNDPLLWKDPTRWFNADESGFPLCPKSGKVLAPKGVPNIYNFTSSDKSQITVLACMNAAGFFLKPLIVYAGQRFSYNPLEEFPDAVFGRTNTGWMDSDLFHTWLKDVFVPALEEHSIKRPVVLFVDGHSTHSTLSASKFCRENNIVLYCLLEHGSHLMQPCDVGLFSTLKTTWRQAVRNYQIKNVGDFVTRSKFAGVFREAWEQACTVQVSVKGFRESGLFPFDPSKVLGTLKMEPSKTFSGSQRFQPEMSSSAIRHLSPSGLPENAPDASFDNETAPTAVVEVSNNKPDNHEQSSDNDTVSTEVPEMSSETVVAGDRPLNLLVPSATVQSNIQVTAELQADAKEPSAQVLTPISSNQVSPAFKEVLKIPTSKSGQKHKKTRIPLPKAISGKKFHDLLEKKQKEKEEEVIRKEARKREREEQRKRREEEKLQKAEEKAKKKQLREQEKENMKKIKMKKIKEIAKLEKAFKRKHLDESSDSDISVHYQDDDMADIDTSIKQACFACEAPYDNATPDWIVCQKCGRWLHRTCVKTIDLLSMTEGEIADLEFECDYC